jgi:hypothetical protein
MPMKPISGRTFATSLEQKQDDRTSEPTEIKWQSVAELHATNDSRLAAANPPTVASGGVDDWVGVEVEVVKEAVTVGVQVCYIERKKQWLLPINSPLSHRVYMIWTSSSVDLIPLLLGRL